MAIYPLESISKTRGIRNQGNTCFLNSILQALAALSHFEGYLLQNQINRQQH